ncbi:P-loop containing nucleoside triphosphate hydrolase protein [Biscogniauxia marginata]|nr:P-loop containing nucleoside triphosphate hydrolase protein [Biscogniauxia marginata]
MDNQAAPRPQATHASRWRGKKRAPRGRVAPYATTSQTSSPVGEDILIQTMDVASMSAPKHSLKIDVPADTPRFADLGRDNVINPILLQTITEDLKFNHMTPVQAATLPLLIQRADVLAQAKTGTGKTIAFLLPAIQDLMNRRAKPGSQVSLLVISPTRELAMQIAEEAKALLQRVPQYKVCIAIGGTNKDTEEARILKGCDILIGTPGRLYDHLGSAGPVVAKLHNLNSLVFDEADRLLDMGFLDSIKKIIACLPDKNATKRQGMLFSATVPSRVRQVAHLALSDGYKSISTISEGELNTHERVPQHLVVVPTFSDVAAALVGSLRQERAHIGEKTFKAIVFAPTAGLVNFYTTVLQNSGNMPQILSLHSRMTQSRRTKTTDEFRKAASGILIATDVIARGMDFPSVTNVFQVGLPSDKESYVHRLGRTARAGAEGRGTLILTKHETYFPRQMLKDITFEESAADLSSQADVLRIASSAEPDSLARTYQAWLGYYKNYIKPMGWSAERLVKEANIFALEGLGVPTVPTLPKGTVGKMGLKGVKGLVVGPNPERPQRTGRGRGDDGESFGEDGAGSKRARNE